MGRQGRSHSAPDEFVQGLAFGAVPLNMPVPMKVGNQSIPPGVALAGIILIAIPCYDLLAMYHAGLRFGTIMRPWVYFINFNASSRYWKIARFWWLLYPCTAFLLLLGKNGFRLLVSVAIVLALVDCTFDALPYTLRGMPPNWGPAMWWSHAAVVVLLYLPSSRPFFSASNLPSPSTVPARGMPAAGQSPPRR